MDQKLDEVPAVSEIFTEQGIKVVRKLMKKGYGAQRRSLKRALWREGRDEPISHKEEKIDGVPPISEIFTEQGIKVVRKLMKKGNGAQRAASVAALRRNENQK